MGTKYLKKDEYVLFKQRIKSADRVSKEALFTQLAQTRNSRLLPFVPVSIPVYVYQIGLNHYDTAKIRRKKDHIAQKYDRKIARASRQTKINRLVSKKNQKIEEKNQKLKEGNAFMKWGEPLAIFDSSQVDLSKQNLKRYLYTKGYFNGSVSAKVRYKKKKASVDYFLSEKEPFTIDSIIYKISDKEMRKVFNQNLKSQNLLGERYDQQLFSDERDRIYDLMTNNGYYNFKRQYVLFEVDSTILDDHQLVVRQTIANPPDQAKHKTFRLDSVVFVNQSPTQSDKVNYKDVTFLLDKRKYPEKQLAYRIFLEKDSLYSKRLTLETQKQLAYLDVFKFVNINYDSTGGKFIASIFTSPLKKFQTSWEAGLSIIEATHNLPGPFVNVNTKSRNLLGGLELLQLDGNISIQGIQGVSEQETNYSRFQYGGELSVTFPQFLFPLSERLNAKIGQYNPRTKLATGVTFEDRRGEYARNTVNANMSYLWQIKDNSTFSLKPFDFSYVYSENTAEFNRILAGLDTTGSPSLVSAFQSSFVNFSSFNFTHNQNNYGLGGNNSSLFQVKIETGGNLENLVGEEPLGPNLEYYKYLKASLDFRRTHRLSRKSQLAYRVYSGAALAYGRNNALPYEKYFFSGGSNSVRAWQPRRLGPGSYARYERTSDTDRIIVDDSREQPGDIIFESSIEYRHDLFGFVDYAFFIDAGNIWLWKSETIEERKDGFEGDVNDDGIFRLKTFPREIAVGSGFGLRFDFSFLVLRVDIAYKIVDPAYPVEQRFILNTYRFRDLWDFQNKAALNIGIGYPF